MKKLLLSLIAVVVGTVGSYAQDDLIATLSHGSSLTTYTGATALSEAYEAAAEGDVITLSPGVFNAVDIEKAITVRGAGMVGLESNGYVSTQLTGNMTINVPSDATSTLTIEGIHALGSVSMSGDNLAPINIIKCRFENAIWPFGINMTAYASIFASSLNAISASSNGTVIKNTTINCLNCVMVVATSQGLKKYGESNGVSKIVATNCIFGSSSPGASTKASLDYSQFCNCIFIHNYPLPDNCSAQSCLGIANKDLFVYIDNPSNLMAEGSGTTAYTAIFKTLTLLGENPAITETFELTETAAATYLGNDGTQVGIYGGSYPFDPTPTNPQIKTFTVSNTTDGGTLKVKINVE